MAPTYHIWTIGCQMNDADTRYVASQLESIGYRAADRPEDADLVILNTCVVRQHAEDKIYGRLGSLQKIKRERPDMKIALMGCLVGVRTKHTGLRHRFPFVDMFVPPSEVNALIEQLDGAPTPDLAADFHQVYNLPTEGSSVTAFVPAVLGCSHACAFCVIPSRRGAEHSRPREDIIQEVKSLTAQGVREVMLLGQIVDRYGLDLPGEYDLADLLRETAQIEELYRVRFLTSHPNWISDKLLDTVAAVDKLCPQMEIALQSANNEVLRRMRRGYTVADYRDLIEKVRSKIPDAAVHTDVIVGFPGETDEQFRDTYRLVADLRFDKVHIAKYSERPGTAAASLYEDNVPEEVKEERRKAVEQLQTDVLKEKAGRLVGETVEVLVEDRDKDRWRGRTPRNKIVFFEDTRDLAGQLVNLRIEWAGPFSMVGRAMTNDGIPKHE